MIRYVKFLGGLLLASTLAACGGGGGSAGTPNNPGGGGTTPPPAAVPVATIDVFTSAAELSTATNSSVTFTVVPKDANNQAIPGQPVAFAASSGNLNGALPTPTTGSSGEPITGVSLSTGADKSNRAITVTVTSGGISKEVVINVVGTALTLSGDSFVLQGGSTTFTAKAVDSAGSPIAGAALTASSSRNNTVTPTTVTTNAQGVATFGYTGTNAGSDTVTISGLGATATAAIAVSADEFRFESPASGTSVNVGANQTVTVRFLQGGAPVVGRTVTFSTTRGSIAPASAVTDAQGRASAVVSSNSAGPANVVAQTGTTQVTLPLLVVATNATTLVLQANPGAVAPNSAGATTNQSTLAATVRDPMGNAVSGRIVNFTAVADGSGGSISPGSAVTDSSGTATSIFYPGGSTTANNGVILQATVQGTAVSGTTALTVNTQALFISISTGNQIGQLDQTTYEKEFAVQVVDVNGAPVANKVVVLTAVPDVYGKGTMAWNGKKWVLTPSVVFCPNEDADRDGVLDGGEDLNNDGRLQPGLPVSLSASSVTTAANGFATFKLRYGENFAPWANVVITARTTVGGTESVKTQDYYLAGETGDFTNENVPPAGSVSPYGTGSCTDPN